MKNLINLVKKLQIRQILTIFLAGILLIVSTACSRPSVAGQTPNMQKSDSTTDYKIPPYEGGIKNFSDVNPRAKAGEKAARDRADELVENAQRNIERKGIDSTHQYLRNYGEGTPISERAKNLGEDVGTSAEELRKGVTKGTQRGFENIQRNVENAAKDLTKNVQRGTEDIGKNIQQRAEDASTAVNRNLKKAD